MAKKDKAAGAAEEIVFSVVEQQSYDAAWKLLNQPSTTFFAPFPSVVNTDEIKFPSNKKIQVTTKVKATSVSNHGTTMTDTATATASSTSVASLPSTSSSNVGAVGLVDGMHPTMSPTANFPSMMRTTVTGTEATDSAIFGVEDIYAPPVPTREPTIAATLFDPGFGMMMNDDDATTTTTTAIAFEAHDQLLRPAMNASTNGHQYPTQRSSVRRQGAMQHQQVLPSIMRVDDTANVSLATLGRGQQELETALKQLEHIEKDSEVGLLHKCDLTRQLTELVTGASYVSATDAIQHLELLGKTVPRRVCQHPFRKNDIVWVCRTCQADETCVLCHACFSQSNHDGHDVAFYHAQAGGCCDCGDPDAWDPNGFCPHHGPNAVPNSDSTSSEAALPTELVQRVRGIVPSCIDWMVKVVATNSEVAYRRANPPKRKSKSSSASSTRANESSAQTYSHQRHQSASSVTAVPPGTLSLAEELLQLQTTTEATLRDLLDENNTIGFAVTNNNHHHHLNSNTNTIRGQARRAISLPIEMMELDMNQNTYLANNNQNEAENSNDNEDEDEENIDVDDDDQSLDAFPTATNDSFDSNLVNRDFASIFQVPTTTNNNSNNINTTTAAASPVSLLSPTRQRFTPPSSFDYGANSSGGMRSLSSSPPSSLHGRASIEGKEAVQQERALQLGIEGSKGHGLYLALHADEIHTKEQLNTVLRSFLSHATYLADDLLTQLVTTLRQYGQLLIWGTRELTTQVGMLTAQLWLQADDNEGIEYNVDACTHVGSVLVERTNRLSQRGLFCSILTRNELISEQRGVAILQWLSCLARSCDPLCLTVAESILPNRHLVPLLRADFKMSARVTKAWYSLLLTLLAVPTFKSHLAAAYCDTYRSVTAKYARGMGVLERSGYTLSVQFLNRVTYVIDLVQKRDLLGKLGKALLETLMVACDRKVLNGRLNPDHFVLSHRRYSPCVSDLKCVLNVKGMPRIIACKGGTFLVDWISSLSVAQFMDSQVWRSWNQVHEFEEYRSWIGAFNASISLGSLFERLLGWEDDEESPIHDPSSPLSRDLMSCVELAQFVLTTGVEKWQHTEKLFYESVPQSAIRLEAQYKRSPASLPFSTAASANGTVLAMRQLQISQVAPFSFHLPLHRFVASCLRELCSRKNSDNGGLGDLLQRLRTQLDKQRNDDLFHGLMEFSVLILSRAAQIRAGLWKRNGQGLSDQVLNYAEPPFCRNMRDADLLLTQFSAIGRTRNLSRNVQTSDSGVAFLSNLLLHRLGIFDITGMTKAPNTDVNRYLEEVQSNLYPGEWSNPGERPECPWTYSPSRDSATSIVLIEEFLYFIIVFVSELPTIVPQTREEQTRQAQFRLFREVIHRLASGSKTHSELSEVHHVLSHWENVLLSEEGKLLNPDDATGAALAAVLSDIAERKVSRGKMEPDKWEMKPSAWDYYDPAFFHISLRCHQSAAEYRPKPVADATASFGWKAKPLAPEPIIAHPFFERLRRDVTADISVLAVTFRVLHKHLSATISLNNTSDQIPLSPYETDIAPENREKSETALARAIHVITLGAYAWQDAKSDNANWRNEGGGSPGSLFYHRSDVDGAPTADSWISSFLAATPSTLFDCKEYEGCENALLLLQRLAVHGGISGGFVAQDKSVQAGAAWICEFALSHCYQTRQILTVVQKEMTRTEIERRKKMAKETAMAKMKAQAAKFASMMDVDLGESEEDESSQGIEVASQVAPSRKLSFGSVQSSMSVTTPVRANGSESPITEVSMVDTTTEIATIPPRLLQSRPRCIICNDEDSSDYRVSEHSDDNDGAGQRKRRAENALAFVGYGQASTVLKGGGGPPLDPSSPGSPAREFVGVHIALCGHAVHSECCDSYLATVSRREERHNSKREEFRCPLCQRLSNVLVPFIDVGVDWIDSPSCKIDSDDKIRTKSGDSMECEIHGNVPLRPKLSNFLESTPWWVTRHNSSVLWDGHSAFVEKIQSEPIERDDSYSRKQNRRIRTLKKKDLYAAWNAMMRTPRLSIVRRSLRRSLSRSNSRSSSPRKELSFAAALGTDVSSGETVVWKRFMDLISDISYRADSRRLEDEHLYDLFGEFRHYIVEKYVYNTTSKISGGDPTDWPSCLFSEVIPDIRRQEMSREKLLSKLLLSIQAFTYSCCSEAFEARRSFRRTSQLSNRTATRIQDSTYDSVLSRFGIANVVCEGKLILLPTPSNKEDGPSPFDGRLGKLRYLALTVMAAAGAVAADLVQLALPFPAAVRLIDSSCYTPLRAPVAYPILLGHVLTHVVAAMCASCGLARARNDSLEVIWPATFSARGNLVSSKESDNKIDAVLDDCEGFLKLGLLARIIQSLLGSLNAVFDSLGSNHTFAIIEQILLLGTEKVPPTELSWINWCISLLKLIFSGMETSVTDADSKMDASPRVSIEVLREATTAAASAGCTFLADAWVIMQILMPGIVAKIKNNLSLEEAIDEASAHEHLERLANCLGLEPLSDILESDIVRDVLSGWYRSAKQHTKEASDRTACAGLDKRLSLQAKLFRTQGFRVVDWPTIGSLEDPGNKRKIGKQESFKIVATEEWPHDDAMQLEGLTNASVQTPITDVLRSEQSPVVLTFSTKKSVPLIGGYPRDSLLSKGGKDRPRVLAMPTSYTDLYAELCTLMPDCEQTAVCLVCGEVLNAGGKAECTNHSHRCGAGAGMFFLLQECTGLIMHKSKAAYIHSPYVDSHGETPQYRGRPLNLDLDRYEHLREMWFTHGVRQKVVAERGSSRQVIQMDFY